MHKSTLVVSVPLGELERQLRRIETWPMYVPELEAVRSTGPGRFVFAVRQGDGILEVPVAIRRSPRGSGMLWTSTSGTAWNGHLYLQAVDAVRTRVHVDLDLAPRSFLGHLVELIGSGRTVAPAGALPHGEDARRTATVA
jgi:hypothetical protein